MPENKWDYKKRTEKTVRERGEARGGNYDDIIKGGVDTYFPKVGSNCIRFLPIPPDADYDHYAIDVFVHQYIGPNSGSYICPVHTKKAWVPKEYRVTRCPACAVSDRAQAQGDKDEAYRFRAIRKCVAWVIDRDKEEEDEKKQLTPRVFKMGYQLDGDIQKCSQSKRAKKTYFIEDPHDGFDVEFFRDGKGKNTRYSGVVIQHDPSPVSTSQRECDRLEKFLADNLLPSVLKFTSPEQLAEIVSGVDDRDTELDDDDRDEDRDEQTRPASKRERERVRSSRGNGEDEDSSDYEDDKDEKDEPKRRDERREDRDERRDERRKRRDDDDEDVAQASDDEDDQTDDESPFDPDDEDARKDKDDEDDNEEEEARQHTRRAKPREREERPREREREERTRPRSNGGRDREQRARR